MTALLTWTGIGTLVLALLALALGVTLKVVSSLLIVCGTFFLLLLVANLIK